MTPAVAGGYVFVAGKSGTGYVLRTTRLGGIGGEVTQLKDFCTGFGTGAVFGSVVYVPCRDNGIRQVTIGADGTPHAAGPPRRRRPTVPRRPEAARYGSSTTTAASFTHSTPPTAPSGQAPTSARRPTRRAEPVWRVARLCRHARWGGRGRRGVMSPVPGHKQSP